MKQLEVQTTAQNYKIEIESGLLDKAGERIAKVANPGRVAIVTDSNVAPLYADRIRKSIEKVGWETTVITVPAGERSKDKEQLFYLYGELLRFGVTRSDLLVALGGGVVGDLAGFAAATLLRGIPFVQIPTTLLAQVDSSVGGKVAIDLPEGKNLVGAFYQPKYVLIDPNCLNTLCNRVFSDGMAEVIKYAAIRDKELFHRLSNIHSRKDLMAQIEDVILTCLRIKQKVVERDTFDTGERMLLNFGHTFGHAIEKQYHYETYTHGEGVAIGMVMACQFGEKRGITPKGTREKIEEILRNYQLPISADISADALLDAASVDKKSEGQKLHLILLSEIGNAEIVDIPKQELII